MYLTDTPISIEMKQILNKLEKGISVDLDEIENTKEMLIASSVINRSISTNLIKNREEIQYSIMQKALKNGAAEFDKDGNISYTKNINNNSRIDIIIGLPGSGKSSSLVFPISMKYGSRIIDNDYIKEHIPEYNDGWGASVVHKESQIIEYNIIDKALQNKENIVLPKIGSDFEKLSQLMEKAKEKGYKVYLHYIKLSKEKALGRIINRFLETGRFLEPELIEKYVNNKQGNLVDITFEKIKQTDLISGYSKWDGDVERNTSLKLMEVKDFNLFDDYNKISRRKKNGR